MARMGPHLRLQTAAWAVAIVLGGLTPAAGAEPAATPPATPPEPQGADPGASSPAEPAARDAKAPGLRVLAATSDRRSDPSSARLGDRITVTVGDLSLLLSRVGGDCQNIVLFLDGIALAGTRAESCDLAGNRVRFWLLRSDDNDREWHALLGSPDGFRRTVPVSLGSTTEFALPTAVEDFGLIVLPRVPFYGFLVLLAAGVYLLVRLARRTDMLRSAAVPGVPGQRPPFSLARSQMAFWFFLVLAAYVFIWLVTEELDTISESVLGLIGIGSGTALGSAMIDAGQPPETAPRRGATGRFTRDVLEGPTGVSFHRFQMLAWTLVLGVIFCASVYRTLAMPEFSPTLLALMGISSGTYLGFKFPENQAAGQAGQRGGQPAAGPQPAAGAAQDPTPGSG